MNFPNLFRNSRIVNITITNYAIRYVELKDLHTLSDAKWGERLIPDGLVKDGKIVNNETLSLILEECVEEWKMKKKNVRFLVPDSSVIIRKVGIPSDLKEDEIEGYLYLELGTTIHLPFEDPFFDFVELPEDFSEKREILIFAAPKERIEEYQQLLSSVKLEPIAADISPLALYRLYHHLHAVEMNEAVMMIQCDLDAVNISIFENQYPLFMHHIVMGNEQEHTSEDNFEVGQENNSMQVNEIDIKFNDVYKEVSRLMDFYRYSMKQGSQQVSKMIVFGDHPLLDQFLSVLQTNVDIPLESLELNEQNDRIDEVLPKSHYLALGLALKEV